MVQQDRVERFREEWNAHLIGERLVDGVLAEVPLFLLFRVGDGHIVNDVLLTAAFNAIVAKRACQKTILRVKSSASLIWLIT